MTIENDKQNVMELSVLQITEVCWMGNNWNVLSFSYYQFHDLSEN